jgi:hypothetical protein
MNLVFPVFPVVVPSLFPESVSRINRFRVFSTVANGDSFLRLHYSFFVDWEHWEQREHNQRSRTYSLTGRGTVMEHLGTAKGRISVAFAKKTCAREMGDTCDPVDQ